MPDEARLGRLRAVTSAVPDLDRVAAAWCGVLGYQLVSREPVGVARAASWGAPAVAERDMLVLRPGCGEPVSVRFVQQPDPPAYRPLTSIGWGAMELVVQDPAALARRLADGPFTVLLEPHGVDGYPYLTALQAAGPAGERLNLTLIDPPQPDLPVARGPVGQCFIATLGVPDIDAARAFYAATFGNAITAVHQVSLSLVNHAHGLPRGTRHPLAVVALGGGAKIELDELPSPASSRAAPPGGLPAGLALVTFDCPGLEAFRPRFLGPPCDGGSAFPDTRTATLLGAAGERIELLAASSPR